MSTFIGTYGKGKNDPYRCPLGIPDHWTELGGDFCSKTLENGDTCFHAGLCAKCYRCPCHCTCPSPSIVAACQEEVTHETHP